MHVIVFPMMPAGPLTARAPKIVQPISNYNALYGPCSNILLSSQDLWLAILKSGVMSRALVSGLAAIVQELESHRDFVISMTQGRGVWGVGPS